MIDSFWLNFSTFTDAYSERHQISKTELFAQNAPSLMFERLQNTPFHIEEFFILQKLRAKSKNQQQNLGRITLKLHVILVGQSTLSH